jgi:hypothetical protein
MRLARVLCLVTLVGFCAVVARGDATAPDPHAVLNSDPCPVLADSVCIAVNYTGPSYFVTILDPLLFLVPGGPVPANPPAYTCSTDLGPFAQCAPIENIFHFPPPPNEFFGFAFWGFYLTDTTYDVAVAGGPISLDLPDDFTCDPSTPGCSDGGDGITLTPEPGTGVLFVSGLILLGLAGFARKRFGARVVS